MAGGGSIGNLAESFVIFAAGSVAGAIGLYTLLNLKAVNVQFKGGPNIAASKLARAYPSFFWDLRDPGASQANFDQKDYYENSIPREGMFSAPPPDFTQPNFSEFDTYTAPRSL